MSFSHEPGTFLEKVSSALAGHRLQEACADLRQMALTDADATVLLGVMTEHCSTLCAVERGRVFRLIKTRVNAVGYPARGDVSALPAPAAGASTSAAPQQQQQLQQQRQEQQVPLGACAPDDVEPQAPSRSNASLQSCQDPGAWLSEEVWGVLTNRFAPWCQIKHSVVSRFLQIGLVRPSETTLQALVAVIWLSRNKVSDDLDVEDCLARKRDLSAAIQTARGKFSQATHPLWGILREYPRNPLELRDFPVFAVAFPSGIVPSKVPFNQLESIRVRIPCRSSNSLVLARPTRARRSSRLAAAAKPMSNYSAFDGTWLMQQQQPPAWGQHQHQQQPLQQQQQPHQHQQQHQQPSSTPAASQPAPSGTQPAPPSAEQPAPQAASGLLPGQNQEQKEQLSTIAGGEQSSSAAPLTAHDQAERLRAVLRRPVARAVLRRPAAASEGKTRAKGKSKSSTPSTGKGKGKGTLSAAGKKAKGAYGCPKCRWALNGCAVCAPHLPRRARKRRTPA